ncbi:MAG TPA: triose-phosphate isomerase [Bacillota bacterium]|nr:triose-phosphate isomerase [Bacillota bacterium]
MTTLNKRLYIGSNLKMYKNVRQTMDFLTQLASLTENISRETIDLFIIPSYTSLYQASLKIDHRLIRLGAQNMYWEDQGPFTGEISPRMLEELGLEIVEIGHSERRQLFGETDQTVNRKVHSCLHHGMTALVCVGETLEEKEANLSAERLRIQVKGALHGVAEEQLDHIWIAYEPVWAIGEHGIPATADYAGLAHEVIRGVLCELFLEKGMDIPILYGGSVNRENALDLIRQPEINGLFIGRSAWEADNFDKIIREVLPVWQAKIG